MSKDKLAAPVVVKNVDSLLPRRNGKRQKNFVIALVQLRGKDVSLLLPVGKMVYLRSLIC